MNKTGFSKGLIACVLLLLCGTAAISQDSAVVRQLFHLKQTDRLVAVEKGAAAWTNVFIDKQYLPSRSTRYTFLPARQNGDMDRLRLRYQVDNMVVTITQTICIFAIQVDYPPDALAESDNRIETITQLAQTLFKDVGQLKLNVAAESTKTMHGTAVRQEDSKTPWLNRSFWWQDSNSIGFYFIKNDGKPSAMRRSMDAESNARWFSNKEGRTRTRRKQ